MDTAEETEPNRLSDIYDEALENLKPQRAEAPDQAFAARLRDRVVRIEDRIDSPSRARSGWHLAQLNIGLFKMALDAPEMAEFVNGLDRINAIAEDSPGFVWRLTDEEGASSSYVDVPGTTDPLIAPNLSVWTGVEALREFMYKTDHVNYLRRRADWFQSQDEAFAVLWWIPAGTIPTLDEAVRRLNVLREHGPTEEGWTFREAFPEPSQQPKGEQMDNQQVLIPYLTVGDTRAALSFYVEVFGAEQTGELFEMPDGRIGHAEMTIGSAVFYLADDFPEMQLVHPAAHGAGRSMSLVINVESCDAVYEHGIAAGATEERPPQDQHGQRSAWFVDPWGHRWCPTGPKA